MANTKIVKESFIKNLNGTSILEVVGIVQYAPLCCLFYFVFHTAFFMDSLRSQNWYVIASVSLTLYFIMNMKYNLTLEEASRSRGIREGMHISNF